LAKAPSASPASKIAAATRLRENGDLDGAKLLLRQVLRQAPRHAQAMNAIALVAIAEGRRDVAETWLRSAIAAAPQDIEPKLNLARCLAERGDWTNALAQLKAAEARQPDSPIVQRRLGDLYAKARQAELAIAHKARARALNPESLDQIRSHIVAKRQVCDWTDYADDDARVRTMVADGERVSPFTMLSLNSTLEEQLTCAQTWGARFVQPPSAQVTRPTRPLADGRLRIGYLSGDFHAHATSYLVVQMMEAHDRRGFEIFGLSYGRDDDSPTRRRMVAAFDHFIDLKAQSDHQAAQTIADLDLDILVDLKGYTEGARTAILGYRPAPIQVNYLGFPGTMGVPFIDYVIADAMVAPLAFQPTSTEQLVHLPGCFQPNDGARAIHPEPVSRTQAGLPGQGFVFCSFNNAYKLGPETFDSWIRIVEATPGSVLWLLATSDLARRNLMREAADRGLDPARLIFAPRLSHDRHLRRLQLADLCLDTLPVAAFTTASDALWAGTPLLTCAGQTAAGRGAVSLLNAMGVPELITDSPAAYEATAIRLARDPAGLGELRRRIAANRSTSALFDTPRHTRAIERAYVEIARRWRGSETPTPYTVPDDD